METLPKRLRNLVTNSPDTIREALKKLRSSGEAQPVVDRQGRQVVIKPLTEGKPPL